MDFFNKVGSLYNRFSGWCSERGKEIKEVGDNFKKAGKELGDQLNEAILGGLQNVSDSVVATSKAISNMTWKDWTKAAISVSAGAVTFAAFFVPGGGVVGAVVNGFIAGGMAGAAGSIAGDSYEVVDAVVSKNQDELFDKYGVKDWSELGNRVLDQAGTSMVKGAIFGSLAAGTQEYVGPKLNPDKSVGQNGNEGASSTKPSKEVIFGSETKSAEKLANQISKRGWTKDLVIDTIDNPYTIRTSVNRATGNSATVYYTKRGSYVIVDDITKAVVQVGDNINPTTWIPDSNIVDPYIPK